MVKDSSKPAARMWLKGLRARRVPLLPPITAPTTFTAPCSLATMRQAKNKWKRRPARSMGSSVSNTHYSQFPGASIQPRILHTFSKTLIDQLIEFVLQKNNHLVGF